MRAILTYSHWKLSINELVELGETEIDSQTFDWQTSKGDKDSKSYILQSEGGYKIRLGSNPACISYEMSWYLAVIDN